jgi:hypothetical protein
LGASVTDPAPIDLVAKALAADLHAEPDDVQEAYRYLLAQVAEQQGILEVVSEEIWPTGAQLVYREPVSGARYAVTRPPTWSRDEEAEYVAELRRCLLADGEARPIPDLSDES